MRRSFAMAGWRAGRARDHGRRHRVCAGRQRAFQSGDPAAVGRYLIRAGAVPARRALIIRPNRHGHAKNYFGGTSEIGHGYHFYHDIDWSEVAAVLIESSNAPPNIREDPGKWTNRHVLTLVAEDLPIAENRVLLEEDASVIEWTGHHPPACRGLQRALDGLPGIVPDEMDSLTAGGIAAHARRSSRWSMALTLPRNRQRRRSAMAMRPF
ncbi:hypothetical protein [Ruegeria arenilitoris]|uniref:hypothetical protein n=1 Tax=Ruegeria arenilitoris TaxID=1173585 RepID=UPI00147EF1F6|nr:hypothetical protein [Ruegeria arenilitoris]